jgi:hypothetical protein
VSRWSVNIFDAPFVTATLVSVNVTAHPLSHIFPTERSECCTNPGMIWACLAACDYEGRLKVAVYVDAMVAPFGRHTFNGVSVSNLFINWALASSKCAVHPESKRAVDCDCGDGVQFR